MQIESLLPSQIEPDPNNARKYFKPGTIEELAESINAYGLLENLVVRKGEVEGNFYLVAGERRWRAVNQLVRIGLRQEDEELLVVIVDGEGTFENLVENLCREELSPWDLGYRFNELVETGYTQAEIAARSGKGKGFVSRCTIIAKGLHPASVDMLNKMSTKIYPAELMRIASLKNADKGPDEKAQREAIEIMAGMRKHRKRRPQKRTDMARVSRRLIYMQHEMLIPRHAQPYVTPVLEYLTGQSKKMKFPEEL